MHILNRRKSIHVTEPQWMRLAWACSFSAMYAGTFTAFFIPELACAAVVGLIPGFVTLGATYLNERSNPL